MAEQDDPFYITGGTMPSDADSYIVRAADKELLDGLRRGEFCYVLNTRQMGKSSLMIRAALARKNDGCRVAVLDLTAVGQNLSVDQWYFGLLTRTAAQVGHMAELVTFWKNNRDLGPMQRFVEAIHQVLLIPHANGEPVAELVLFVDEIDAILSLPFSVDEFFGGIRECYNRRSQDPTFYQLTFCLLGVAAPTDLVQDARLSPFNIGRRIELRDFTPQEAAALAHGFALKSAQKQKRSQYLLRRILYWTGGHPYMTQRLCKSVAGHLLPAAIPVLQPGADVNCVDQSCRNLFLTAAAQDTDDNLTFVRNRLLRSGTDTTKLLHFYGRIRRGERVADDDTNNICWLLKLSGVVTHRDGLLHMRSRVYTKVFDARWIEDNLPEQEVRRQRHAYRLGIWRAATMSGVIVIGFAVLASVAMDRSVTARRMALRAEQQGKRATELESIARTRLSHNYVDMGVRLMDAGDYGAALSPLSEAILLDKDDADRLAMHRRRFASVLARTPSIEHLWSSDKPIRWASYSPDKKWIASAGEDGLAHVWEVATGGELPLTIEHPGGILHAAFRPDGKWLVTCGADGYACVWDLEKQRLLYKLHPRKPTTKDAVPGRMASKAVDFAAWSKDGRRLAVSQGDVVDIWDIGAGGAGPKFVLPEPSFFANAKDRKIVFSPDGNRGASIASNNRGFVIDLETSKLFGIDTGPATANYSGSVAVFSKDGTHLLVAGLFGGLSQYRGASVFDVQPQHARFQAGKKEFYFRPILPYLSHSERATYASFSPDEQRIATASEDGTARIWNATTGKAVTPVLRHEGKINRIAFSLDGKRVVTASIDGTVRVWNARTGILVCAPLHHAGAVVTAEFGNDSDHLLTASSDGTTRVWTLPSSATITQSLDISPNNHFLTFSTDGTRLIESSARKIDTEPTYVRVYETESNTFPLPLVVSTDHFADTNAPGGYDSHNRYLFHGPGFFTVQERENPATFSSLRNVQLWDVSGGVPVSPCLQADVSAMNHAGTQILIGNKEGMFRLIDVATGRIVGLPWQGALGYRFDGRFAPFSPDDHVVVVPYGKQSLCLIDTRTGVPLTPALDHSESIGQFKFSRDGRYLFTWTKANRARVWNVTDGTPASEHIADIKSFHYWEWGDALQFSADGKYAMMTGFDGIWLWRLTGEKHLRPQHLDIQAFSVRFSPDSKMFVVLGQTAWLWRVDTLTSVISSDGTKLRDVVFSPDGKRVLAIRDDGTAVVWDVYAARPITSPLQQKKIKTGVFSSDGRMIATGGYDGIVQAWDASSGEPLTPVLRKHGEVSTLKFSPDGTLLAGDGQAEACLWKIPDVSSDPEALQSYAQLLSGQRLDPIMGPVPINKATIRAAWKRVMITNQMRHTGRGRIGTKQNQDH